jgi:hypothetical protein
MTGGIEMSGGLVDRGHTISFQFQPVILLWLSLGISFNIPLDQ